MSNQKCYCCGQAGHVKANCPAKHRKGGAGQRGQGRPGLPTGADWGRPGLPAGNVWLDQASLLVQVG
uniref:CCHC-type domain-containing protein n=1 Tax=Aquila chrysaetos chrysaetos TaxID=223781 RepID=A0A663FJ88_AQUCH